MSIEKLCDNSKIHAERSPFTQILNDVIEFIKDNDAYRMYSYLISKSRDWVVVKDWTAKNCDVGITKAKQCWSYLERCGLIEYVQVRNEHGKFVKHDMRVLIGTKFLKDVPFIKPKDPIDIKTDPVDVHRYENPPGGKPIRMEKRPLLNIDLNQQGKKPLPNKEKSFSDIKNRKAENDKKHEFAESMNQMANEQKHIEAHEKIKVIETTMSDACKAEIHELTMKLKRGVKV